MSIGHMIEETIGYLAEAMAVIFGLHGETQPLIGVQPFTGEIYHDRF
jgi:hypothetical protein